VESRPVESRPNGHARHKMSVMSIERHAVPFVIDKHPDVGRYFRAPRLCIGCKLYCDAFYCRVPRLAVIGWTSHSIDRVTESQGLELINSLMGDSLVIDADGHIMEDGVDWRERIDQAYKERAQELASVRVRKPYNTENLLRILGS